MDSTLSFAIGGLSAASLFASFVSVPMLRRWAFGDVRVDWLNGELDFDDLDHDNITVRMKQDGVFRVIKLAGMGYDTKLETEQQNLLAGRSMVLHDLARKNITVRMFAIKRQRNMSFSADWPTEVLQEIGDKEKELYSSTYDLDWYMVLQSTSAATLETACENLTSALLPYNPVFLSGAELYRFINYLLCGEMLDASSFDTKRKIATALPGSDLNFDYDSGILRTATPETHYQQVISIRGWPEVVSGMLLAELLAVNADLEIGHILRPESTNKTRGKISSKQKEQNSSMQLFRNLALSEENNELLALLNEGNVSVFLSQCSITLRASSLKELEHIRTEIVGILSKWRIAYGIDTGAVGWYWFNRLPFKDRLIRPLKLINPSIAGLWTWHNSPIGQYASPWGDRPLRMFKTPVGQNYAFNFHVGQKQNSLGHFLVIAPSGGGKSTLLAHLLGGLSKFDIPSVIFDSLQGMRFMVEAMGGQYQSVHNLALNPFDCDDAPEKRIHLAGLLRSMGMSIQQSEIELLLDQMFMIEREYRSLNEVYQTVFARASISQNEFARWVTDRDGNEGMYSSMFNAPRDSLGDVLDQSFMSAFNMGEVLNDPTLAAPVVAHVMDGIREIGKHRQGFCVFIDEAAALLRNEGFRGYVMQMYREYRKFGGAVGMAFQDPKAFIESDVSDAVLDNIATLILFPNSQGNRAVYERFGLNEEQMNYILKGSLLSQDRTALVIKRDSTGFEESTIINIDLSPYDSALRFYQSGTDAVRLLEQLQQKWGAEWSKHI